MATYVTTIKNRKAVFTDNYIQIENLILYYDKMSNIRYKIGQSGFAFEYDGKNVLIPCEANEKDKMMPFFSKAVTLERQRKARELTLDDFSFDGLDSKSKEINLKEQEPIKSTPMEMPTMTIPPISMESNAFENNNNQPINIQQTTSQNFDPLANMQINNNKPNKKSANTNEITTDIKPFWKVGRLVIGIISMVLFILIVFQSCAAGLSNALEESSSISGSAGFFLSLAMLAGGIVGVATRKSIKKSGCIASSIVYAVGSLFGAIEWNSTFSDLKVWVIISILFSAFYMFCAIMTKNDKRKKHIVGYVIYGIILLLTILLIAIGESGTTSSTTNTTDVPSKTEEQAQDTNSDTPVETLSVEPGEIYNDHGVTISVDEIAQTSSTTTLTFIIDNSSEKDYDIAVHSWDVNGVMGGGNQYGGGTEVSSGSKAKGKIDIDNEFLKNNNIDTISDINVVFWAYEGYFKEWNTDRLKIKTNFYDKKYKVTIDSDPIYSDDIVDVWNLGSNNNTYTLAIYNKSDYNATCTLDSCSINGWSYDITDYSMDSYSELINSNSILCINLPIDSDFLEENKISTIESIEINVFIEDDNWNFEGDKWEHKTGKIQVPIN